MFYVKLCRNSHFTYYLHTTQTICHLNNPILYHCVPPNSFVFDLDYTICTSSILRANLKFKKLLKCVDTLNFLRTNLSCKQAKNVPIAPSYFFPTQTKKAPKICQYH